MDAARKLVIFPTDQFYAVIGNITLPVNPYSMSLTDILTDQSAMTHRKGDHEHRPGKIFLSEAECYGLFDNTQRVCSIMTEFFISVQQIRAVIDVHPERYQGNASKRQESQPRVRHHRDLLFPLHGQAVCGVADALDIYRKSEQFIGLNSITIHEEPATAAGLSLPEFLRHVDCPPPSFMAVNLKCVIHS